MSNLIYCARCGKALQIHRKAMPNFNRIIDIVEPHKCGTKVEDIDLGKPTPIPMPTDLNENKDYKFVQKLNDLKPSSVAGTGDKRAKEHVKQETSTAPASLIDNMFNFGNTIPEGDISKDPDNEETE